MDAAKPQFTSDYSEFETRDAGYQKSVKVARMVESIRLGLTALALAAGITIVGVAGDTLSEYNTTHLGQDFFLDLWPADFDLRPTIALVACGAVVLLASMVSLVVSKLPPIRSNPVIHSGISFVAPTVCLIAGLVGMSFFYGVNSSRTTFSLQSWTCQWSAIDMNVKPHWNTLCKESKVALYLMVMIVPLEAVVLATAAWGSFTEKRSLIVRERKGSPAMS